MNVSMKEIIVTRVWVDATKVYAETADGLLASYELSSWPRLARASDSQRQDFQLSYFGIHWPQIDEDLSFEGMFLDNHLINATDNITICCNTGCLRT